MIYDYKYKSLTARRKKSYLDFIYKTGLWNEADNVANLLWLLKLHYFGEILTCLESQSLHCERRDYPQFAVILEKNLGNVSKCGSLLGSQ